MELVGKVLIVASIFGFIVSWIWALGCASKIIRTVHPSCPEKYSIKEIFAPFSLSQDKGKGTTHDNTHGVEICFFSVAFFAPAFLILGDYIYGEMTYTGDWSDIHAISSALISLYNGIGALYKFGRDIPKSYYEKGRKDVQSTFKLYERCVAGERERSYMELGMTREEALERIAFENDRAMSQLTDYAKENLGL